MPATDGDRLRQEQAERHDQFDDVVDQDASRVNAVRHPVEVPAERVRHRLRLVVVVETGQVRQQMSPRILIRPAPSISRNSVHRHIQRSHAFGCRAGPTGEDREEADLAQQDLPAETVEGLADVDEGEIEDPEKRPDAGRGAARPRCCGHALKATSDSATPSHAAARKTLSLGAR